MSPGFQIVPARTAADIEAVRDLCREYVSALLAEHPEHHAALTAYFTPARWAKLLDDLPAIHARPGGDMLLLHAAGRPVGCIMWKPSMVGVAEVKRLFVQPALRGQGGGSALVEAAIEMARDDGYRHLQLETAAFMSGAQALFRSCGFWVIPRQSGHALEMRAKNILFRRRV